MGMGDDILATVQARSLHEATGYRVRFGDGTGAYDSPVYRGNPHVEQGRDPFIWASNYPGNRPYVLGITQERFIWNPLFKARPGDLFPNELPRIAKWMIEPNVKGTISADNKDWGFANWQWVVDAIGPERFFQCGPAGTRTLSGVQFIQTNNFMEAVDYLNASDGFAGTDGGLHHAAAALDKPAVVLWGGYLSPEIMGYDAHVNIWSGAESCGSKQSCPHCREAMRQINASDVADAILRTADEGAHRASQDQSSGAVSVGD